jgi:hypothetical protein
MRFRRRGPDDSEDGELTAEGRIQKDLESLGVSSAFSEAVAERISILASELDRETYSAVLDGVAVAFDAHRGDCETIEERARDIDEIQRLMKGFAGELRKLEEGLRIVSAYVLRMHSKARGERGRVLH